MLGTTVAQMFAIQQSDSGYGYSMVGKPLSTVCFVFSIGTVVMGGFRSWRHQHAVLGGKALVGGLGVATLALGSLVVSLLPRPSG
jgi:hypothetical protein